MIYEKGKPKMKRKVRQFLSGFLALLMVVSLLPQMALVSEASTSDAEYSVQVDVNGEPQKITSGFTVTDGSSSHKFQVTMPDTVTDVDGNTAYWTGWGGAASVTAIVEAGDYAGMAVATVNDDTGKTLEFTLGYGWETNFNTDTRITIVGGNYRTSYSVVIGGDTQAADYGAEIVLPETTTKTEQDKVFLGWSDGTDTYAPGETVVVKGNMTFSEVFGYDGSYVVVFQDGTGSVLASGIAEADPATGQADASDLKPTEPQRDGSCVV